MSATDAKLSAFVKKALEASPPSVPAFKFAESAAIVISVPVLDKAIPAPPIKLFSCKLPVETLV